MKKIIVTLIFLLPFMSGCTKVDSTLTINNNKSAQIEVKVLTDKTARPLEMATVRANIDKFVDKSYKIVDNSNPQKIDLIAKKNC